MLTIVILHWNRHQLLMNTLESFTHSEYKDFNVVIVDNKSDKPVVIPSLPYEVHLIQLTNEPYTKNFISAHNYGFYYTLRNICPDRVIMQHAECSHAGDVISRAATVTDENYISFGCYSIGKGSDPATAKIEERAMTFDGDNAWYNHSRHRPRKTHFCAAITTNNLRKLNGFDERFCEGVWYDDDYFLLQVQRLGLRVDLCDDPFVFHQYHENAWTDRSKIAINQKVFADLKDQATYEAVHIYTSDFI